MYIKAKAKINLFLHITGKREDGYHLMQSMMVFAEDVYDVIKPQLSEQNSTLVTDGIFANVLANESNNLIDKAADIFTHAKKYQYSLTKNIPIGAGLGGGSSDAAQVAAFLNNFKPLDNELNKKLVSIGADLPICYHAQASLCSGIGDVIEPIKNFPELYLVLVNPRKNLLTKEVFKNNRRINTPIVKVPESFANTEQLIDFLSSLNNDLTESAIELMPEVKYMLELIDAQLDCYFSRMSGSGATCFGVFANEFAAKQASYKIAALEPNYWVRHTKVA